jgi:hypothetical protein
MKKIIYFLMGCVLLGFLFSFIFSIIPVFSNSANGFLLTLKQGHYEEAYDFMSDPFKAKYDIDAFKTFVDQNELNQYQKCEWIKTFISDDKKTGFVMGTLTTIKGKKIPIKIDYVMVKGPGGWLDQGWRIQSIELNTKQQQKN